MLSLYTRANIWECQTPEDNLLNDYTFVFVSEVGMGDFDISCIKTRNAC